MIQESAYIEAMKNCSKWNNKNIVSRVKNNLAVFDQQTSIVQKPTDHLIRSRLERCTPTNPLQVCSYPQKRYKRNKEIKNEVSEFNYLRFAYPEIDRAIFVLTDPGGSSQPTGEMAEQSGIQLRPSNNNVAKNNDYEDFDDSLDFDFEEPDDGDEWGSRRKSRKTNNRGRDAGRSRRSNVPPQTAAIQPMPSVPREQLNESSNSAQSASAPEHRPFICQRKPSIRSYNPQ
jgi:hypothetical protein